jgi:hypothetical protein
MSQKKKREESLYGARDEADLQRQLAQIERAARSAMKGDQNSSIPSSDPGNRLQSGNQSSQQASQGRRQAEPSSSSGSSKPEAKDRSYVNYNEQLHHKLTMVVIGMDSIWFEDKAISKES